MKPFKKPSQDEIAKISQVAGTFSAAVAKLEPAQVAPVRGYQTGSTYDVPISEIKVNPYNARRLMSQDGIDELEPLVNDGLRRRIAVLKGQVLRRSRADHCIECEPAL